VTWKLIIELDWPSTATVSTHATGLDFEALLREVVDPLHRENVIVHGVSLEQVPEP
jgi:hypothetical protein